MAARTFAIVLAASLAVAFLSRLCGSDGAVNDRDKIWQVRYHQKQPNINLDLTMRLHVIREGPYLHGRLQRYGRITPPDAAGKRFYKLRPEGGDIPVNGKKIFPGDAKHRLLETFEPADNYMDAMGNVHNVRIVGFHHPARERHPTIDDVLDIRVTDRLPNEGGNKTNDVDGPWRAPDIDILVEVENDGTPPYYDAEVP
jgi:hypothetical protein